MIRKQVFFLCAVFLLTIKASTQPCAFVWDPTRRLSETPGASFNPVMAIVGDTVHAIYFGGLSDNRLYYRRSTNGGASWGDQRVIVDDNLDVSVWSRPLAADGSNIFVVWGEVLASGFVRAIRLTRSTDGGDTWLEPQDLLLNSIGSSFVDQNVAASGGCAYVGVDKLQGNLPEQIFFLRSSDGGATWDTVRQLTSGQRSHGLSDIVAQGASVRIAMVVDVSSSSRNEMGYIGSGDHGDSWSPITVLSTVDGFDGWGARVAANGAGSVYVGWQDAKYGSVGGFAGTLLMRRSMDSGATWFPEQRCSALASAGGSTLTASGNHVYAAWEDSRLGNSSPRVYVTGSSDDGVTWCDESLVGNSNLKSAGPDLGSSAGDVHLSVCIDTLSSKIYYTRQEIVLVVPTDKEPSIPLSAKLLAPYPNPFNGETTISFELPRRGEVKVIVYDLLGREAQKLAGGEHEAGEYRIKWSAANVASGVYVVAFSFGGRREAKPILSVK